VERGLGRNSALVGEVELLQHELLASGGEVRQPVQVGDVVGGDGEAGVEATEEVQDELWVGDGAADIAEHVGGGLHPLRVVVDGGIALSHGVKLVTQEDGTRSLVGLEEAPDGDPELITATRPMMSGPTEPRSQLRTQASAMPQVGSVGRASSSLSTCGRRANFPQREVKNGSH
jgi:hypothetical protein